MKTQFQYRATTAGGSRRPFEAAMRSKGPRLIEAQIVRTLNAGIGAVHHS